MSEGQNCPHKRFEVEVGVNRILDRQRMSRAARLSRRLERLTDRILEKCFGRGNLATGQFA